MRLRRCRAAGAACSSQISTPTMLCANQPAAAGCPRKLIATARVWLAASAGIVAGTARFTLLAAAIRFGRAILILIIALERLRLARDDADK